MFMKTLVGIYVPSFPGNDHSQWMGASNCSSFSLSLTDCKIAARFNTCPLWNGQFGSGKCRFNGFKLPVECRSDAQEAAKGPGRGEVNTLEVVSQIIAKQLTIAPSAVKPDSNLAELGADSLDMVEILMSIEDQFNISLPEGGAEKVMTVQDAVNLIKEIIPNSFPN